MVLYGTYDELTFKKHKENLRSMTYFHVSVEGISFQ